MANRRKPRGVLRTLEILRALNASNGSTVGELHAITGVSRPSLYRVLEAFRGAGYVTRDPRGGFHLTHLVRTLSDGFRNEDRLAEIAMPVLQALQKQVLWPADLALYANHAMTLRETTRPTSSLVMDRVQIGLRIPIFPSAVGLAYVAFCPDAEREAILDALRASDRPEDQLARDARRVAQMLRQTRADGYGRRLGAIPGVSAPETGAIAVPVRHNGKVAACIAVTFFAKVMKAEEAARRYLVAMNQAAARIERQLPRGD